MIRHDLSDRLIRLTRGHTLAGNRGEKAIREQEAMANFCSIKLEWQLWGRFVPDVRSSMLPIYGTRIYLTTDTEGRRGSLAEVGAVRADALFRD